MLRNLFLNAVNVVRSSSKASRRKPARGFSQPMESLEARVVLSPTTLVGPVNLREFPIIDIGDPIPPDHLTFTPIGPIDVMPAQLNNQTHELTINAQEGGHAVKLKVNGEKLEVWLDGKLRSTFVLNQVQSVKFTGSAGVTKRKDSGRLFFRSCCRRESSRGSAGL